ncbi:hypothetical protein T01_1018 [Trichinella spiralis]|uniref:Apple domain-containing protein n=1 Tax=Trichinella spiralis TaxID=6334 RepID=A0A0V1BY60_TRISP|nr:hypothetical protein T01_1018 [Trichinella spiralis]
MGHKTLCMKIDTLGLKGNTSLVLLFISQVNYLKSDFIVQQLIKCVLLKERICQTLKNALINVSNGMHFVTATMFYTTGRKGNMAIIYDLQAAQYDNYKIYNKRELLKLQSPHEECIIEQFPFSKIFCVVYAIPSKMKFCLCYCQILTSKGSCNAILFADAEETCKLLNY